MPWLPGVGGDRFSFLNVQAGSIRFPSDMVSYGINVVWFGSCWSCLIELLLVLLVSDYIIMSCFEVFDLYNYIRVCVCVCFFQFLCVTSSYLKQHDKVSSTHPKLYLNITEPKFIILIINTSSLLGGGFKYFLGFHPKIGEEFQFDEHIFQMGWNHQLVWDPSYLPTFTYIYHTNQPHSCRVETTNKWFIYRKNNLKLLMCFSKAGPKFPGKEQMLTFIEDDLSGLSPPNVGFVRESGPQNGCISV